SDLLRTIKFEPCWSYLPILMTANNSKGPVTEKIPIRGFPLSCLWVGLHDYRALPGPIWIKMEMCSLRFIVRHMQPSINHSIASQGEGSQSSIIGFCSAIEHGLPRASGSGIR